MAIYNENIVDIELTGGNIFRSFLSHTIGAGDELANRFGVRVFRNGEPEDIGGTCFGLFIRADGTTVTIASGSVNGNVAYVTLPEACYAVEGNFTLAIKCQGGGTTGTLRIVDGVVSRTSTSAAVDPGNIIPSIDDLIDAIDEAVASIPLDYSALSHETKDQQAMTDSIGKEVYNFDEISTSAQATGWRLNETDGFCTQNSGYNLKKYAVSAGDVLRIVSDDRFQFQNNASVPSSGTSNRIGATYGAGDFVLVAPTNATYLIVSTPASDSACAVYTSYESKVEVIEKKTGVMDMPVEWITGKYIDSDGEYVTYAEFNASKLIPVYDDSFMLKRNIFIRVRLNTAAYIAFFDKNKELITTETTSISSGNPIFETDTDHVAGCCFVAVSALVHYDPVITFAFADTDVGGLYDALQDKRNLFDPFDTRTKVGKYIDNTGAIVSISSEYAVSHPIPVKGGVSYTYNQPARKFGSGAHYVICDAMGNIIDKRTGVTISSDTVTFTETNSCFVMVNISLDATGRDFFKLCETAIFSAHYRQYFGRLTGKKILYNGDSIAQSRFSGYEDNGGGYPYIISKITGSTYENRAVGGGTLAANDDYHSVCEDVTNMSANADLVCFEGGINDYWQNIPLGTFSESDFTGTVDENTVCGALESIFRQATAKWVGAPIVFVIVHKITTTAWTQNSAGYTFADAREKMIGICNKYSIPYLDMWAEGGLNAYISALNTAYLNGGANVHPDGCHPDANGYKKYYVPRLISLFESLLPYDE